MQSLLLSSEHVTTAVSDERKALVSVAKRSQDLLLAFDVQEQMVEPLAAFAIALDRFSGWQMNCYRKSSILFTCQLP